MRGREYSNVMRNILSGRYHLGFIRKHPKSDQFRVQILNGHVACNVTNQPAQICAIPILDTWEVWFWSHSAKPEQNPELAHDHNAHV